MSHPNDEIEKRSRAITHTATQLKAPDSWGISDTKLFLQEISTGAAVTRHCAAFEIHVQGLPVWLRNIDFIRSATIRGSRMRRIKVPKIMDDLNMFRLSGLATFIVLCCRYSEDEDNINKMVELLVVGELGTIIKIDRDLYPQVPYTFKGHIGTFITSCLDADRDSDTSRQVNTWMAELHDFGELTWHSKDLFIREKQASIDLMKELFGAAGLEEDMARRAGQSSQASATDDQAGGWAKIHNTLHLTTAYIALAAAAHKACVVVECISSRGSKSFPKELDSEEQKTAFLVRLWLVQPPEHVRSILRQSGRTFTSDVENQHDMREDGDEEVVVVGGTLELATWIARKLEFRISLTENMEAESFLELWRAGVEYGKKLRWSTKRRLSTATFGILLFALETPEQRSNLPVEALPLCKALLSIDKRLRPVARDVAKIVHGFYRLDDYSSFLGEDEGVADSEYVKAMHFVITSISIQALCNTMNPVGDSIDSYALNLATLNGGTRDLDSSLQRPQFGEGLNFEIQSTIDIQGRAPQTFVELTKSDLLDLRGFTVKGNAGVIVKGLGDAAWATFALGCAAGPSVSTHHLLTFIYRGDPTYFDIEEFRGNMNEGQVIIMVP
ncbi:hypothetical protein INS49_015556 [Diaporthe citri]|uniref:uncharacterized protein n=1 Tax=Diaporthe citri TaxID=83186 RepID=UPI001C819166|nr:uncharacterized protein INS49_015556 [Diaporthe citri]KAG6356169.1 hypothetical protein INS49_015556 [Diaporthe citri]